MSKPKSLILILFTCFIFLPFASYAADGIDSVEGTDLPINAGGTKVMTLKHTTGNVGIGTSVPAAKLDIAGEIKLAPSDLPCTAQKEGALRFGASTRKIEYCDGSTWKSVDEKPTLVSEQVSCVGYYLGSSNDYGCTATCPEGTVVTGGGYNWGAIYSQSGRLMYKNGNGFFCLINVDSCSGGGSGCGSGCYAICTKAQ